jgi:hypothetical protein
MCDDVLVVTVVELGQRSRDWLTKNGDERHSVLPRSLRG